MASEGECSWSDEPGDHEPRERPASGTFSGSDAGDSGVFVCRHPDHAHLAQPGPHPDHLRPVVRPLVGDGLEAHAQPEGYAVAGEGQHLVAVPCLAQLPFGDQGVVPVGECEGASDR
jgi:hypothetical protein